MNPANEFPYADAAALARRATSTTGPVVGSPMPGGASARRFARLHLDSGKTLVAIHVPDAHRSDELEKPAGSSARWPFLEIRDLLARRGIQVPAVVCEACDQGLLLVEDLGDLTLAVALEQNPRERTRFYQRAVGDLAFAQRALAELPADSIVRQRAFDEELLRWEIDHFREWALEARGVVLTTEERNVFDHAADFLARTIASWPRGFVHRDYQSRNLMVRFDADGRFHITWIDFQDALLGPRVYDLVALLGDSYQTFDDAFVEARLDEYAATLGLEQSDRQHLKREFDLVTVQRKLKDAGRFVFIDRVKHNPSFLGFVEPTIEKVYLALTRLRDQPCLFALETLLHSRLD
jgi:N-acetylmuramate 1-kinase